MRLAHLNLLVLQFLWLGLALPACGDEPVHWMGGAARIDITPDQPVWMAGYASRNAPSEGVLVPLAARAIALRDTRGHRLVIVSLEVLETPDSLQQKIMRIAREKHGLHPEEFLLNVSHTHGGPMLSARNVADWGIDAAWGDRAESYSGELTDRVDQLIGTALSRQQPVELRFGQGECGFAMNRRIKTTSGMRMGPNPEGKTDHVVPVLRIDTADGGLLALVFGYSCHNTALGDIRRLHGDYAGLTQQRIETKHPGAVALFLMGCGGDQDPHPRRNREDAERNADRLSGAVEEALTNSGAPLSARLDASLEMCPLAFQPLAPKADFEARSQSPDGFVARHARQVLQNWPPEGNQPADYLLPVQVVVLGKQLTLVALGGEPVVDYAHRLRRELASVNRPVWVAGYSNRVNAYLPSRRVLEEGGYEGTEAIIYQSLPAPFGLDVEQRVVESVLRQEKQLRRPVFDEPAPD